MKNKNLFTIRMNKLRMNKKILISLLFLFKLTSIHAQNTQSLPPLISYILEDDVAYSITVCNADYVESGGSGVGNMQFNSFYGQIASSDPEANLENVTVYVITRTVSINNEESFVNLGAVNTDDTGLFERGVSLQFTLPFVNENVTSVDTFFSFNEFQVISYGTNSTEIVFDVSSAVCSHSDTDLDAPLVIAE